MLRYINNFSLSSWSKSHREWVISEQKKSDSTYFDEIRIKCAEISTEYPKYKTIILMWVIEVSSRLHSNPIEISYPGYDIK